MASLSILNNELYFSYLCCVININISYLIMKFKKFFNNVDILFLMPVYVLTSGFYKSMK